MVNISIFQNVGKVKRIFQRRKTRLASKTTSVHAKFVLEQTFKEG